MQFVRRTVFVASRSFARRYGDDDAFRARQSACGLQLAVKLEVSWDGQEARGSGARLL
jgi:hypothetical protein